LKGELFLITNQKVNNAEHASNFQIDLIGENGDVLLPGVGTYEKLIGSRLIKFSIEVDNSIRLKATGDKALLKIWMKDAPEISRTFDVYFPIVDR
jgi:hypothetical protein